MATDYPALVAAWNATGRPAGTTGTNLTAGMTQEEKLIAINGWTVAAPVPAIITPAQLFSALDTNEIISAAGVPQFTQLQLTLLQILLSPREIDASPNKTARTIGARLFTGKPNTIANLAALVAPFDNATTEWWRSKEFTQPIGTADLTVAGLS